MPALPRCNIDELLRQSLLTTPNTLNQSAITAGSSVNQPAITDSSYHQSLLKPVSNQSQDGGTPKVVVFDAHVDPLPPIGCPRQREEDGADRGENGTRTEQNNSAAFFVTEVKYDDSHFD